MEFCHFSLFVTFVMLTVDRFVERGDGPFELQKQKRHFNLPNDAKEDMSICGLSLHKSTTDSRKNLDQRFIFQIGTLNPHDFSFN